MIRGYAHPRYAQSLAEFGQPRELPHCGGWILERKIPGVSAYDAIGCYPLFACSDWSQLHLDLAEIKGDLICLSLVTDPFGAYDPDYLHSCFKDVVYPFKHHFVVDLNQSPQKFVSNHHRRYSRKALREVRVEICQNPLQYLDEWMDLYDVLIDRHQIKGISAFSKTAFSQQLQVPGLVMFRAIYNETTIGINLWYLNQETSYYHLAAYSDKGYEMRASFAMFWQALGYFAEKGLKWLNLGGGAGLKDDQSDGLSRFKRGWSTETQPAYFCGHIFDHQRYSDIVQTKGISKTSYFPAYRSGEFRGY